MSPNHRISYARVSTGDQNLDLQRDALTRAGCSSMYEEIASGKRSTRPELEHCLRPLRAGDTLVVWRLDRLCRSLPDLVKIVAELERRGAGFESLQEKIETESAGGKLQLHVFAALAEFERNLIRERTRAGLAAKQIREIKATLQAPDILVGDLAKRYGVSRTTIYKHVGAVQPKKD